MADFTPLSGPIKSKPFLTFDIESKDEADTCKAGFTRPFMTGMYDTKYGYRSFFDHDQGATWDTRYYLKGGCVDRGMRSILRSEFAGHHIYAHNAGRFDYLFVLPWLMHVGVPLGFNFSIIPVASSIQVLDIWRGNRKTGQTWRFLDSYKLIPVGLDKAAKMFGLEGKLAHDLNISEFDIKSWRKYNEQDCVQNYEVVKLFHNYIEKVLLGEVGITAPATSIKLLRRRYLKAPIPRNEETHEFVRSGYFGGRTEVFIREGTGLKYFDINSSYPAAMLEAMPGGTASEWEGTPPDCMLKQIGFANVDVYVPETLRIPPLPVKGDGKENGPAKLIFPVGRLTGTWEWGELQQAMSMGCTIEHWHKSVWYEPVGLFAEFVHDLYKYRDRSLPGYDDGLAQVVKILLNSAYGKFGMKTERKQIYMAGDPDMPEQSKPVNGDIDCPIWYGTKIVDAPYVMPQIAARVTALARVRLLKGMLTALDKGGDVFYCDTDSIVTNVDLPTGSALGELKDEFPEYNGKLHGLFVGPKLYLLDAPGGFEKVKAKGMQKRDRDILNRLMAGEAIDQPRLEKVGGMAQRSFMHGPRMLNVPKRLLPDKGKRVMNADGTSTPYVLRMW